MLSEIIEINPFIISHISLALVELFGFIAICMKTIYALKD
jgi:hypothetical protein